MAALPLRITRTRELVAPAAAAPDLYVRIERRAAEIRLGRLRLTGARLRPVAVEFGPASARSALPIREPRDRRLLIAQRVLALATLAALLLPALRRASTRHRPRD